MSNLSPRHTEVAINSEDIYQEDEEEGDEDWKNAIDQDTEKDLLSQNFDETNDMLSSLPPSIKFVILIHVTINIP